MQNPVREALQSLTRKVGRIVDDWNANPQQGGIGRHPLTKCVEAARAALALPAPTPDAWMLKTGHGVMFAVGKPSSEIDLWTPLYVEPPAPREPDDVIRALQANNGPLSDRERRLAVAAWYAGVAEPKAAPSEIARDAARLRELLATAAR
jgi:hypothetical protein